LAPIFEKGVGVNSVDFILKEQTKMSPRLAVYDWLWASEVSASKKTAFIAKI